MSTEVETKADNQLVPEDRDWQLGKRLEECMLEMYERQLFTDITFTFQQKVHLILVDVIVLLLLLFLLPYF